MPPGTPNQSVFTQGKTVGSRGRPTLSVKLCLAYGGGPIENAVRSPLIRFRSALRALRVAKREFKNTGASRARQDFDIAKHIWNKRGLTFWQEEVERQECEGGRQHGVLQRSSHSNPV